MPFVLVWSCGPVQDFIASARKGRDLWFGSWLLSEVSKAAALAVVEATGGVEALVMPAPDDRAALERDDFNASNKLLVRTGSDPAALAEAMSAAAGDRLQAIAAQALDKVAADIRRGEAEAQIGDLLEVSWAAASEEQAGGYAGARRMAEVLHAARKGDRPFRQPSWAGAVPKSSLDGARESVIPERVYDELRANPEQLRRRYGAGPAERLSGIGLLKRFGHHAARDKRGARIQSTSHVASWSTRRRLKPELHKDAFDDYIQQLIGLDAELSEHPGRPDPVTGRWDGHVLYESRLSDFVPDGGLEAARRALRELFQRWREASVLAGHDPPGRPTPYFAVLVADGDRLGRELDKLTEPAAHRAATRRLESFAAEAEAILRRPEYGGQAVYTGGDDVLALLPARTALGCARALAEAFEALKIGGSTMSAGVCIGHHLDPLHRTLEAARSAEQHAKQVEGRDAWAITLSKRGGSPVTLGGKWAELARLTDLIALYEGVGEGDRGRLPRGLAYDMRAAHHRLSHEDAARHEAMTELRELEGLRMLIQKGMRSAGEPPPPGSAAAVVEGQIKGGDLLGLARRLELARALTAFDGGAA